MELKRSFPWVFGLFVAAGIPSVAQADVFELSNTGQFVEISKPAWQPEPAPELDAPMVLQTQAMPASTPSQLGVRQHIQHAAAQYGVNGHLVDAVAWQESRYNPRARSSAGAIGVMQLMPGTAKQLGVSNPHDVRQNVAGGAAYLREQLERFGNNVPLALAAYNAGPGAVVKYGGIPPYRETQNYVRQIMQRMSATMAYRFIY
jgi:soluble lytic murein transglycosylase-like protein